MVSSRSEGKEESVPASTTQALGQHSLVSLPDMAFGPDKRKFLQPWSLAMGSLDVLGSALRDAPA
jgi:hypothetical protein